MPQSRRCWLMPVLTLYFAAAARAQTDARLLAEPWPNSRPTTFDVDVSAYILGKGHTRDGSDRDIRIARYESQGRWRSDAQVENPFVAGYELLYVDLSTGHAAVPERLVDQSVGIGFGVGQWDPWSVGVTLAAGYAGSNPFGDDDALYIDSTILLSRRPAPDTVLQLMLNYNSNRTIFPDIPLPGIAYSKRVDETLTWTLGVPRSRIVWTPDGNWTFDVDYVLPVTVNGTVRYRLTADLSAFGRFTNRFNAFTVDGAREHERVFLSQRMVEAGIACRIAHAAELTVAGGWVFGQTLQSGFDARSLDDHIDFSDEPFVRFGLDLRF